MGNMIGVAKLEEFLDQKWWVTSWLVVSTQLKNISQIGSFPQVGVKIRNVWNHQLGEWFFFSSGEFWRVYPNHLEYDTLEVQHATIFLVQLVSKFHHDFSGMKLKIIFQKVHLPIFDQNGG